MRIILFFLVLSLGMLSHGQDDSTQFCGISLVSEKVMLKPEQVDPLIEVHANWVAVIPYAFMPKIDGPALFYDSDMQWIGERKEGVRRAIELLHDQNLAVMLKPQIWIHHDGFAGHVDMRKKSDWEKLEENYRIYLMDFVQIAIELDVEMICIGTELSKFVAKRSNYWRELISEIRSIYTGKITYAENWDSYSNVEFWSELDYVGIDAYFPLSLKDSPSEKDLIKAWKKLEKQLSLFADVLDKQIIFTEYGYRSVSDCANKPWDYSQNGEFDENAQQQALRALYEVMWDQPYFAGGFLWKWEPDHENAGGKGNLKYTVQNKGSEKLVNSIYQRASSL